MVGVVGMQKGGSGGDGGGGGVGFGVSGSPRKTRGRRRGEGSGDGHVTVWGKLRLNLKDQFYNFAKSNFDIYIKKDFQFELLRLADAKINK
ncbi:hypothetical protein L2E82_01660 [Cichorium intybus]|uniref:Uncharacterized protein n=1 Tax=Cichorium intybus TaxID=13427 RepID=A0ACB9GZJ1_CICIN|nr:hypothetical protein L2E82_01660 [Cichorium intybus]